MVVAAHLFVVSVLALDKPAQILLEPFAYHCLVPGIPGPGLGQKFHALDGADQNAAIHDSRATALIDIGNGLRVIQTRIHARFRIDEPGMDYASGALSILRSIQQERRRAE